MAHCRKQASNHDDDAVHYIFGFGSIINTSTHSPWLEDSTAVLTGQRATLRKSFNYRRGWNFRSSTGFTALGIAQSNKEERADDICGVLFCLGPSAVLQGFDQREVGYTRVEIPRDQIVIHVHNGDSFPPDDSKCYHMWVYIPQAESLAPADEDHPILQSYVDTVLQGCLEWGGEDMCCEFVQTTHQWSSFFLNDTPSSRRPWLFRKEYQTIDRILSANPVTKFQERRHPEEFASAFLVKMMRGSWSVPRRNVYFTGRDAVLTQIHTELVRQTSTTSHNNNNNNHQVAQLQVTGMGGVGKSQLCTEYCYRYFPSYYGLVIWLSAQTAESITAGYRQLMADTTGIDVSDKDTDEVVSEVKSRLFRSQVPWLLVFDNLEDATLLDKFVPNGGLYGGHLLVTTRMLLPELAPVVALKCFEPSESVDLLRRTVSVSDNHEQSAHKLADRLGHLPLALSMAAAYMERCDVSCVEYLTRYESSERTGSALGNESVASSLSLSLNAIREQNEAAWQALRLLSWLGPDRISKKLLRSLLTARREEDKEHQRKALTESDQAFLVMMGGVGLSVCLFLALARNRTSRNSIVGIAAAVGLVWVGQARSSLNNSLKRGESGQFASSASLRGSPSVFDETDQVWTMLKSFSLLIIKNGEGSIHRLLSQALRMSQTKRETNLNLDVCRRALRASWSFRTDDVLTWPSATNLLEHVKSLCRHVDQKDDYRITADNVALCRDAGVFSAMALNRFQEAEQSLEQALRMIRGLESKPPSQESYALTLHELGRVQRYQSKFSEAEQSLLQALRILKDIRSGRAKENTSKAVASTLHELGVLEVKKHNLESAESFLEEALDLRRDLEQVFPGEESEANCASTLHQLAAIHVAKRPPCLGTAESFLKEALGLSMQIGQRAATLKQLSRVAIRRGEFALAHDNLAQSLELYVELYGPGTAHINVAAVKFQQGALAFQCEKFDEAWTHFSESLRMRRQVYAYAQGNHVEVSSVLHHLGRVAVAMGRLDTAKDMLKDEHAILDLLTTEHQALYQAKLTNLTWLRKCAKLDGDEEEWQALTEKRTMMKKKSTEDPDIQRSINVDVKHPHVVALHREVLRCRAIARKYATGKTELENGGNHECELREALDVLLKQCDRSIKGASLRDAAVSFHRSLTDATDKWDKKAVLLACDNMRDALRQHGFKVTDAAAIRG